MEGTSGFALRRDVRLWKIIFLSYLSASFLQKTQIRLTVNWFRFSFIAYKDKPLNQNLVANESEFLLAKKLFQFATIANSFNSFKD